MKRACLKKLPNQLIMVLKRFEFDYDSMTKVKVNDYCEFPTKINLEPYTQQGLRKAEKHKKEEKNTEKTENEDVHQDVNQGTNDEKSNEKEYLESYFEYKLAGVVIHLGVADSGHYYSLIQDRELDDVSEDRKWYEFNDTIVKYFDPKDIPNEAYGGEEKFYSTLGNILIMFNRWRYYQVSDNTPNIMSSLKEKIKNAYLLFYDRIVPYGEEVNSPTTNTEAPKKEEEAKEENSKLKSDKNINKKKAKVEEEDENTAITKKEQL